jgi:hypothetical protein
MVKEHEDKQTVLVDSHDNPIATNELDPAPAHALSVVSNVCGCEVTGEAFCNYDSGATGACESCSDVPTIDACSAMGLPAAGAADCALWCFGNGGGGDGDGGDDDDNDDDDGSLPLCMMDCPNAAQTNYNLTLAYASEDDDLWLQILCMLLSTDDNSCWSNCDGGVIEDINEMMGYCGGRVICPGMSGEHYCDGVGDCGGSFCECEEALSLCDSNGGGDTGADEGDSDAGAGEGGSDADAPTSVPPSAPTTISIRGKSCLQSNVLTVNNNCVAGPPHYDAEGSVCAYDGNSAPHYDASREAYCSYGVSAAACARCEPTLTPPSNWEQLKIRCGSSSCDMANGGCTIVLSDDFIMGSYASEISFSGRMITLWGQGKVLDASGSGQFFKGIDGDSLLELHDAVLQNGSTDVSE